MIKAGRRQLILGIASPERFPIGFYGLWLILVSLVTACRPDLKKASVVVDSVAYISGSSAIVIGSVVNDGNSPVITKGVCWSERPGPTLSDSTIRSYRQSSGFGPLEGDLTNLKPNTTYYVRAYATNDAGIAYSNEVVFRTKELEILTDSRDGQTYPSVKIGTQTWMAGNLNFKVAGPNHSFKGSTSGPSFGLLYDWPTACRVCPSGWHLPGDGEWKQLERHLGMAQEELDRLGGRGTTEGGKLKEPGYKRWFALTTVRATNESGFSALPAGEYNSADNTFYSESSGAFFWTSTPAGESRAWMRMLWSDDNKLYRSDAGAVKFFMSVRCVKD